jgi:hypothetical protein
MRICEKKTLEKILILRENINGIVGTVKKSVDWFQIFE